MNGIDYSKQLARERDYFREATRKAKDSAEKQVSATNERAEHVINKQRENFIEDRADLEQHYQESLKGLKGKTQDSLAEEAAKFNNKRAEEQQQFAQESLKKSKDFDQRLNDIKSSYQKAFVSEKDRHEDLSDVQKNKYTKNVKEITNNADNQLKEYQDRLTGAGADLKDQYNRERQQLVRNHEDHLTDVYKGNSKKQAELKDRIMTDVKKTKEVHASNLEHQKHYTDDRMKTLQENYQDRFDTMTKDYSDHNKQLAETKQLEAKKTNREHQEKITDVQRDFNKSLRSIELEKRRRDNGSGEFAEVMDRQQGLKDKVINENRMNNLRSQLTEAQRRYEEKATLDQDNFNQTLKVEASEAVAREDRKLNTLNADKIVSVSKEREKALAQVNNREEQNLLDKTAYEHKLMLEKNNANQRITKLKENFHTSMKSLEEKHKASLEDVTKVANQDKNLFVKKMQENRSNEVFEMKREFTKMMDATVQDYEQRLATYQRDNEYLKMSMSEKIQNILDQTSNQLESQRTLFEDRRAADLKDQQTMMDQREASLKSQLSQTNNSYQKKIDKLQIESDSKLKLITNDYENKLKVLRASTSKDIAQKDITHKTEQDRLKQTYEEEKNRLISAYEGKISSMKEGHKDQMEQMKDFKRLS